MRIASLLALGMVLSACSSAVVRSAPPPAHLPSSSVVVTGSKEGPRKLKGVPPGHYPPPGECRLWYDGRPPGHQPAPAPCRALIGNVPPGAFVLYNDAAWDSEYDWRGHERSNAGSVPDVILRLMPDPHER